MLGRSRGWDLDMLSPRGCDQTQTSRHRAGRHVAVGERRATPNTRSAGMSRRLGAEERVDAVTAPQMQLHVVIDPPIVVGAAGGACLVSGDGRWKARVMVLQA